LKVLFYDNGATGHHAGYLAGLVAEAERKHVDFMIASAFLPSTLADEARWIEAPPAPLRDLRTNRAALARATRLGSARGIDTLIDLYLDKQVWNVYSIRDMDKCVHVLHHAKQYSFDNRAGAAKARTIFLRRRLRRWTQSGATIVVHTTTSRRILQRFLPRERVILAGYPVSQSSLRRQRSNATRPTLLFIGAGRKEKGLDTLFEALARDPDLARLLILGRQPPDVRSVLSREFPQVSAEWHDTFVDDTTLSEAYATSDLAVLPYRLRFGHHGGPSSVLLESLSSGIPIVTTPALQDQLPRDYRGALIAESDTPERLLEALRNSLDCLSDLSDAAEREGPTFIAEKHTYERYLDTLLDAAATSHRG
jgi:glycosyltransferase involved in cell wall biosynthesis